MLGNMRILKKPKKTSNRLKFNMDNILISICARGGSKGVPGKNIKPINGLPLIGYTIKTANKFAKQHRADISLSTDSEEIIDVASKFGLKTNYKRPEHLATSSSGKIPVIQSLKEYEEKIRGKKYDFVIDLDVTSPLRTVQDLNNAFHLLKKNKEAHNIFSVNEANRNPYFNMVELQSNGFVKVCKDAGNILSRQKAPAVYDMNASFYIFRSSFFDLNYNTSTTDKSLAYVMEHLCFDIDHPIDFTIMEFLITQNLLDIEL